MPQYELNLRDYWQIIRRRRWLAILCFVAVFLSTYIYTKSQVVLYRSTATVRIVERQTLTSLLTDLLSAVATTPIGSHVRMVSSRPVVERVVRQLNLIPEDATPEAMDSQVASVQGAIHAESISRTDLIRIEVVHSNPQLAADIANKVAESFRIENLLENNKQARTLRGFVETQLVETKQQLKQSEDSLQAFKEQESVTGVAISLVSNIAALETEKSKLQRRYTAKHPDIIRIEEEMRSLQERMQNVSENELQFARLSREVALNEENYRNLQEKYNEAKIAEAEKVSDVSIVDSAIVPKRPFKPRVKLNMALGVVMGLLLSLSMALVSEQLDTSLGTIEDIENTLKLHVLSVVPFLTLKEERKPGLLKNLSFDLKRKPDTVTQLRSQLLINYSPKSSIVESYRMLYTNLRLEGFTAGGMRNKLIQFTSSGPEEGKSISIINLGTIMAQEGVRVLLIDMDLRRSLIHKVFGFPRQPGFTDVILGSVDLNRATKGIADIVVSSKLDLERLLQLPGIDNLSILSSGTSVVNVTQLLESQEMFRFFDTLRQNYDIVLFDSPPILAVSDPVMIAPKMDGVVLVYRVGKTARNAILRAKVQLEAVKAQVKGVVLNNISPEVQLYSNYYYYPYKYYGEEGKRSKKRNA